VRIRRTCAVAVLRLLTGLAAAGGLGTSGHAMDPNRALSQYPRQAWDAETGFPGGAVQALAQGNDGYLWIGSEKGLVRFDGVEFRLLPRADAPTNSSDQVLGLVGDGDGSLWARVQAPSLVRYRDGRFESSFVGLDPGEPAVTAMSRGPDGGLLLTALRGGALRHRAGRFERLAPTEAMPPGLVIAMAEAPGGRIWLGTRDAGLFSLASGRVTPVSEGLPDRKVNCILVIHDHDVWVGTDNGVVRWNGAELTREGVWPALSRIRALTMIRDRESNVWIGTGDGLLRVNSRGVATFADVPEPSRGAVTVLFEDREGNLWTGGARGIQRLRDPRFTTYARAQGLPSDSNGPIYVDTRGRTWFAPSEGGLFWLRDGQVGRVATAGLGADVVYSLAGAKDGLWIGRQRGGLTHLRFEGDSFAAKTYTRADGLAQDSVYAVHESRDGTVWAGTLSGGLSRLRHDRFTTYTTANGLASNTVASIGDTSDGTVWLATPNGLNAFAEERFKVYRASEGLPSESVNCFVEDSAGVLWVGTAEGLAFVRAGRVERPRESPESVREAILGLAEDGEGRLWMTTARRVLRLKRESALAGIVNDEDAISYGLADGLLGVEGVKRHRSVVADPSGSVWFSLNRGLAVVDGRRVTRTSAPAVVHVVGLSADGRPVGLEEAPRLPPRPQRVNVSYAGVSLSVPERVRFRYRLDGFDQDWSEPVATREAAYTNLGPGAYQFRVTASNSDGLWNGSEARLRFVIAPAPWQTWWVQVLGVLAVGLLARAVHVWRLRLATRRLNTLFEERLAERTRIAQELHDTLLQGFLSASLQLHVAVDELPEAAPEKPRLRRILELMRQVTLEGRNALRGLRSATDGADDLEQAFSRIGQELAIPDAAHFRVFTFGSPRSLNPVIRDDVYRIGREAVVNAVRHSRAGNIEVELSYATDGLRVVVRDDGCGMDAAVLHSGREGHWGLPGMRERAERVGARFKLSSAAGAGTEIELTVPGEVAFPRLPSGRPRPWWSRVSPWRLKSKSPGSGPGR
jgi:signal transduction histidine kinase/ligand-binding sensor domain-containing protein